MVAVLCEARWSQLSGLPLSRSVRSVTIQGHDELVMVYLERLAERALLLFCLSEMSTASGDDHSPMLVGLSKVSGHQRATRP